MIDPSLLLVDRTRLQQFALLGRVRRLFADRPQIRWTDTDGIPWAGVRIEGMGFAVSGLGSGWVFDPFIVEHQEEKVSKRKSQLSDPAAAQQFLREAMGALRLGARCERILWSVHRELRMAGCSTFRVPDVTLGRDVYGPDRQDWPRHWRSDLLQILKGLSYLHVAEWGGIDRPDFGTVTALLTLVADLWGHESDRCDRTCPLHGRQRHHHFQVNVGRGFLGILEQLADKDDGTGIRKYDFFRTSKDDGPTLRQLGKTGRVVSLFLPALLGDPDACSVLDQRQRSLLQVILREGTRVSGKKPKKEDDDMGSFELNKGWFVPDHCSKKSIYCPFLKRDGTYVSFNGNGVRRGLGYRLASDGGWLFKAGYKSPFRLDDIRDFVDDLTVLSGKLGLVVVGLLPHAEPPWINLQRLRELCRMASQMDVLERLHLRAYAEEGWEDRWTEIFSGHADQPAQEQIVPNLTDRLLALPGRKSEIAREIGVDPSLLSKLLRGKKPWPASIMEKAQRFLDKKNKKAPEIVAVPDPLAHLWTGEALHDDAEPTNILDFAIQLVTMGWSVVPMRPGEKKPCVKWREYQTRRPTETELRRWYAQWPDAGIAVILGPLSRLFVIDVDGPEAHQVLLQRLGGVPMTPLAVSGSRKLNRYHLYFQYPAGVETSAKATPWHPSLEFRGDRGLIVVPPSMHKSGHRYIWASGRSLAEVPLASVPDLVLQELLPAKPDAAVSTANTITAPLANLLPNNLANSTRQFLEGKYAEGPDWNRRLFKAACDMYARGYSREQAEPFLLAGAKPWNPSEKETALRTIESAFSQLRQPARS